MKKLIALLTVLALCLSSCAAPAVPDDSVQAYLMSVVDEGRARVGIYSEEGSLLGYIDAPACYPAVSFDPWGAAFNTSQIAFLRGDTLNYWIAGEYGAGGWEGAALVSPGGRVITDFKYVDIFKIDEGCFLGISGAGSADFINDGGVYATISSPAGVECFAAGGAVRAGLPGGGTLAVGKDSVNIPEGVAYIGPDAKVISSGWEDGMYFSDGLCAVLADKLWGFIDKTGQMAISPRFHEVFAFYDGRCAVETEKGDALIDKTGALVKEEFYEELINMPGGMAAAMKDDKWGYIDGGMNPVGPMEYDVVNPFARGCGLAFKTDDDGFPISCAVITHEREYELPKGVCAYEALGEGKLAAFDEDAQKMGVCGYDGRFLQEPSYDDITAVMSFEGGAPDVNGEGAGAAVYVYTGDGGELVGYIDDGLNEVLKPQYISIDYFNGRRFIARDADKTYLLASDGSIAAQAQSPELSAQGGVEEFLNNV